MTFFRWLIGLPAAALITSGLFAFMAAMIAQDRGPLPPQIEFPKIKILANPPLESEPPDSKRPEPTETPPPPEYKTPAREELPGGLVDFPEFVAPDNGPDLTTQNHYAPTIRYAPGYPESCRSKNAQGIVTVQFNVAPDGRVVDPQIISSDHSCFNRTVIRTISKWKYPPAQQGGRAVMRYGVVEVFRFQLED